MRVRAAALLCTMLVAAFAMVTVTVEAVRTRRLELGGGGVGDDVPEGFYGSSFLPDALLDNVGWIIAAGVVWIVVAALLAARGVGATTQETTTSTRR